MTRQRDSSAQLAAKPESVAAVRLLVNEYAAEPAPIPTSATARINPNV
jgi:hypothetical protein